MRIQAAGERSLLVELDGMAAVHHLYTSLRAAPPPGVEDVVAGATTVLVILSSGRHLQQAEEAIRRGAMAAPAVAREARWVDIPVVYDGVDLDELAGLAGTTPEGVAQLHAGATYTVAFLGFSPGFAYLAGAHPDLHVPRLATPRTVVPAGSVALAAGMTAVYPQPTPGGWRLIGRSDARLFDPGRAEPALLRPGDRVRFRPVAELAEAPVTAPGSRPQAARRLAAREPYLLVLDPGSHTTIQDRGRAGWAHLGVPRSGAADMASAALANRLVGNRSGAAVLEAGLSGVRLRLGTARRVAVTGARAEVLVDGLPARQDCGLALGAGAEVTVGPVWAGTRAYVGVEGGIAVAPVLGSRSTDTLSWLGPDPLAAGDRLPLGPPVPAGAPVGLGVPRSVPECGPLHLRARAGPRHDWLSPAGMAILDGGLFRVGASSDRTGVRLSGPVVEVDRSGDLPSEGMVAGAVQIPPDGQPIVLLRNHPTTGGYPVAAVVDDTGLDRLAQARPGVTVRFDIVGG